MRQASQAASRALSSAYAPRPRSGSGSSTTLSREQAQQVVEAWSRFVEIYADLWTKDHGEQPPPMPTDGSAPSLWLLTLANLTPEELARGFKALIEQGKRYPPSLSEFYALCRPKPAGVRYLGRPIDRRKLLAPRVASPEVRERCLAEIRKTLAGRDEPEPHTERPIWTRRSCTCRGEGTCDTCQFFARVTARTNRAAAERGEEGHGAHG